ncbi:hypothetical protein BJ986_000267 [Phycicoccus badiiscoriae]|uniref:Abnormal spindle-like microcephaly-associated protein ASH domain-containing protein n=1 Tax=Pedococcus badiiscoriae TaxID=642776 RepID=A0A852WAX5_9MICO|nr:hypothetical protein [Pedococcus badiiscoriae]NYG05780.1 hypothetical protein [Pedococcus badiiscoriae]
MATIPQDDWRRRPGIFFAVNVISMSLLLVAVLVYSSNPGPTRLYWSFSFQSVVPLWVPWAGALGGATISLVGIVKHAHDWDPDYYLWHIARPLLGGVCGTIGVLIVVLLIKSVTASPATPPSGGSAAAVPVAYDGPGIAILAVIAFVIGFREETFRHLIERVADVILGPGSATAKDIVAFVPRSLDLVTTGTTPVSSTVHLFNGSKDALGIAAASLVVEPSTAGFVAELQNEGAVAPGDAASVTITWTPTGPGTVTAKLTAQLGGYAADLQLRGVST